MDKRILRQIVPFATVALLLSSCTNNDYDLSDIDTNVRVEVNDLVVPVNLEPVMLDDMLDIKEGDRIERMTVNGKTIYAVIEKGSFESGEINIEPMSIKKPVMPTIADELDVNITDALKQIPETFDSHTFNELTPFLGLLGLDDYTQLVHFEIKDAKEIIDFHAENLDHALIKIGRIGVSADFIVTLTFPGMENIVSTYHINNLKVQLPKGLETDNAHYDKATGILAYETISASEDLKVQIELNITGIDSEIAGATLKDHNFTFSQEVSASGSIDLFLKDVNKSMSVVDLRNLSAIDYLCDAHFNSNIDVTTFSGAIRYEVESPHIDPVDLSDLPEVLIQTGTRLEMTNPQIYVSVTNPIDKKFAINPMAKLSLTPNMKNTSMPFVQDVQLYDAQSVFCLAPMLPEEFYNEGGEHNYSAARYQQFENLGRILSCDNGSGSAIPTKISIEVDPLVEQEVNNFELKKYGKVKGSYAFVAPLALTSSSVICYEKSWDDWGDEDLDNLTVRSAVLTATVTSDVPASISSETVATLLGRDANGKTVRLSGKAALPANATDYALEIKLDEGQPISKIYGMDLKVRATGNDATLAPSQKISVKDVKVKFSGYYEKEL